MDEERYKKIMSDLGMPNSRSLLSALQQVANEVAQEKDARIAELERGRDGFHDAIFIERTTVESAIKNLQHASYCPITPGYPEDCLCPIRSLRAALEPLK